ncbi:MAG: hypothetical protein R3176_00960, partial [Woeseiaceae bacterium]|nr:hypothetical protein [Woeseiaceae bacterium]
RIRIDGATGMPGAPSFYGTGHPNRMYLDVIQYYIANNVGASQDNGDGTYTVEYFTALPADFTGRAMVAIGGHPAAIGVEDADGVVGNQRAAASSVVWYPAGAERDFAVAADNCNACHKDLQFHGANRTTNVEICIVCHNADLAENEGFAFGRMIHSIHTASPSYAGGEFAEVTYPQSIANCDTCHVEGAYNTARVEARAVSLAAGADGTVWTDDIATTPTAQACGTCHMSVAAMGHFNTQGGAVAITKDLIQQVGGLPNGQEACAVCHGPGNEFDTTRYHNPGVE